MKTRCPLCYAPPQISAVASVLGGQSYERAKIKERGHPHDCEGGPAVDTAGWDYLGKDLAHIFLIDERLCAHIERD